MKPSSGREKGALPDWSREGTFMEAEMPSSGRDWKMLDSKTHLIGGEQAREFARKHNELPASPTERPVKPDRIERLNAAIEEGRAVAFNWVKVLLGGVEYRMNGQHSSKVLSSFKGDLPEVLVFHVDRYEASSKEGMVDLFRQFDTRWSSRSKADVAGAFQGLNDAVAACARDKARLAIEGVAWYRRYREKTYVPSEDAVYSLFFDEPLHPFIRFVDEILTVKTPELKNVGVMAATYETFIKSEQAARDFWKHVAMNDVADDNDPRSVLSRELVELKEKKRGDITPRAEYYAKSIKAWNALQAGEKISSLKVNIKKELPSAVA